MIDATVNFEHSILGVLCSLEVSVDIGSDGENIVIIIFCYFLCDLFQDMISVVRIFLSVHGQS